MNFRLGTVALAGFFLVSCVTAPLPRSMGFINQAIPSDALFGLPEVKVNSLALNGYDQDFVASLARQAAQAAGFHVQAMDKSYGFRLLIEEHPYTLGIERFQSVSCLIIVTRLTDGVTERIGQVSYSSDSAVPLNSANQIYALFERAFSELAVAIMFSPVRR